MKAICKICPQLALCLIQPNSAALDPGSFYPRRVEVWNSTQFVFECFSPHPTGDKQPSNGGSPIDVFRLPLQRKQSRQRWC